MIVSESTIDLFSDHTLANTESQYQALRDTGAIVYLSTNDLYAVTRYDAVKQALRADRILVNSKGVAANPIINERGGDGTLTSDGKTHMRRRSILMRPLIPCRWSTTYCRVFRRFLSA